MHSDGGDKKVVSEAAKANQEDGVITCPYCTDTVPYLTSIDSGLRLRLQQDAKMATAPEAVCDGCHKMLAKMVSKGAVLRAEQKAKEENRLTLWRNRVSLIRQAKKLLAQKNLPEAAVAYEKYLRILEIVYEQKPGTLSPELFKSQARAQEMTVVASVYWDLMRIYDAHSRYADRQLKAAEKLAQFARYTPIFPHIMRKAEVQTRQAKNPEAFRKFLKLSNASRPRCFIATAAFAGQRTDTVDALCLFRDQYLKKSRFGRRFIVMYYRVSPSVAELLDRHSYLKPATRKVLNWVAQCRFVRNNLNP